MNVKSYIYNCKDTETTVTPTTTTVDPTDATQEPSEATLEPTDATAESSSCELVAGPYKTPDENADNACKLVNVYYWHELDGVEGCEMSCLTDTVADCNAFYFAPTTTKPSGRCIGMHCPEGPNPFRTNMNVKSYIYNCKDTETTVTPTTTTVDPTDATQEPSEVTLEPTNATPEPTDATPKPTEATSEPTQPVKTKGPCFKIRDRDACLRNVDDRRKYKGQRCGWCPHEPCESNGNRCEPEGWLVKHSIEHTFDALDPCVECELLYSKGTCTKNDSPAALAEESFLAPVVQQSRAGAARVVHDALALVGACAILYGAWTHFFTKRDRIYMEMVNESDSL